METEKKGKLQIGRKYLDALEKKEIEHHYFSSDLQKEVPERKKRLIVKNSSTNNKIIELVINEDTNTIEATLFDNSEYIEGDTLDIFKDLLISHYSELSKQTKKNTKLFFNKTEVSIDEFIEILSKQTIEGDEFTPLSEEIDETLAMLEIEYEEYEEDEEDEEYEADSISFTSVDSINDEIVENDSDYKIKTLLNNEIAIHINRVKGEVFVKLPMPIKKNKVKINEVGKIIEKLCQDKEYRIYAINEAGEVYTELSMEKLLGKEKMTTKDEGKYIYKYKGSKTKAYIDDFNKSFEIYADDRENKKIIGKIVEKLEKEKNLYNESKFVLLRSKSIFEYDFEEIGRMFYENDNVSMFQTGCEEIIAYIKDLYKITDSKEKPQKSTEEYEILVDTIDAEISNMQNAIIIEKDDKTKRVDKYIYDNRKQEVIHNATVKCDSNNLYTKGIYININEYISNLIRTSIEKYGEVTEISFLTIEGKEIEFYELLESVFKFCSEAGGFFVGKEYSKLISKKENIVYKDLEELYDESIESYDDVTLKKGLYLRKDKIDQCFEKLKLKTTVHKNTNKELEKSYSK